MSTPGSPRYRRSPYLVLYWSDNQPMLLNAHTLAGYQVNPNLIAFLSQLSEWRSEEEVGGRRAVHRYRRSRGTRQAGLARNLGRYQKESMRQLRVGPDRACGPAPNVLRRILARSCRSHSPPVKPRFADRPATELPPPAGLPAITLAHALEKRRSRRNYAARPLCIEELSALLHHSARVVECVTDPQLGDRMLRPFPTAGARSELETYIVSVNIAALEGGVYYYDASRHRLLKIRDRDAHFEQILRSVNTAAGGKLNRDPALVLLITAVFERLLWKYRNLGLSLIYKDVGAFLQTLYLVATVLELAPCAIGSGDEAGNSRWLGLDPLCESQVGCFIAGPAAP